MATQIRRDLYADVTSRKGQPRPCRASTGLTREAVKRKLRAEGKVKASLLSASLGRRSRARRGNRPAHIRKNRGRDVCPQQQSNRARQYPGLRTRRAKPASGYGAAPPRFANARSRRRAFRSQDSHCQASWGGLPAPCCGAASSLAWGRPQNRR
jgi:hypothetical protein